MRFPRCLTALAVLIALTVAASACGGGNTGPGASTNPTASAPDATAPPTDATQPGTAPTTPPPARTTSPPATPTAPPQTQTAPAGGGGEQQVRVPASFVVTPTGRLMPPVITVPPFLAVEISIRSHDGRPHTLVLRTAQPHTLQVAANGRAAVRIPGLRAGHYVVTLDGRPAGVLVTGGEVGP